MEHWVPKRTHTLSNGEVIWDMAGNVWEWTSYYGILIINLRQLDILMNITAISIWYSKYKNRFYFSSSY